MFTATREAGFRVAGNPLPPRTLEIHQQGPRDDPDLYGGICCLVKFVVANFAAGNFAETPGFCVVNYADNPGNDVVCRALQAR